ncbi:MAG: hypothetical protein EBT52_07160 [Flavobacteriia bacterium]|nr:hypothetical protein [Flavobacteriia bacterium]
MQANRTLKRFSLFSVCVGILHFAMETWFHFAFGQSMVQLLADYIGVCLLVYSGIRTFMNPISRGLLCGAWGYAFCLNYRAFAWRLDAFQDGASTGLMDNTLIVLACTLLFSLLAFAYTLIICSTKNQP